MNKKGSILISVLIIMMFFATVALSLMSYSNLNLIRAQGRIMALQAQYAAESGADHAIAELNDGNNAYPGTGGEIQIIQNGNLYRSTYEVTLADGADAKQKVLTAVGKVYQPASATSPKYTRTIEVLAERSSSTIAASMMSRNIVETGSAVKDLKGKDIFVNNYIKMNKNVTNLIAENIVVADRETSANNCSIGGTGNIIKPASFTTPGQTKTKITMAYNNCINPPGNASGADFEVTPNTPVAKIQSLYIPWDEYMDATYQNAPGGCNDWLGSGTRDIPSTGNTKKTHYPNSDSNVEFTCGSSGNIDLGTKTFNIKDHVHVRADFCRTSACQPTFNNPDSTIKFIFVEGTVNFEQLLTSPGSGPIVMVIYGADPASKTSVCPLGGAVYLGNKGNTSTIAPALYLLGMNGVCLDKTKFGSDESLGGIGGKNLYISTNSGTPKDLAFDLDFPVNEIPVDLAWRASQYRRL